MTDHEDGPPSRGPRRYGPSAPRSGGRPIVPPRGRFDDGANSRAWSGRPGNTADRRRPDSSGRFPQDDRRRPAGDNGFTGGPYQPDAPVGPRAWSAADRPPPSDRRFPDRVSAGVPAQSDRRITEPRRSPPLPPTDGRPRPPHGPAKRRRARPAARPGDPTRPLAPQTVDRSAGRRRAVGHHPGGVRVRVVRVRQHRPAGQGHHLRLRRRFHLHRHHDPARRLRRPGGRGGQPAQRPGAAGGGHRGHRRRDQHRHDDADPHPGRRRPGHRGVDPARLVDRGSAARPVQHRRRPRPLRGQQGQLLLRQREVLHRRRSWSPPASPMPPPASATPATPAARC